MRRYKPQFDPLDFEGDVRIPPHTVYVSQSSASHAVALPAGTVLAAA